MNVPTFESVQAFFDWHHKLILRNLYLTLWIAVLVAVGHIFGCQNTIEMNRLRDRVESLEQKVRDLEER